MTKSQSKRFQVFHEAVCAAVLGLTKGKNSVNGELLCAAIGELESHKAVLVQAVLPPPAEWL